MPIVRGGQVFGVLTVQNKAERLYAEEEVEALQTVAMVLAEVVAQGGFFNIAELDEPELRVDRPRKFRGEGLSEGVAVGRVVLHEPRVKVERMIADNPAGRAQARWKTAIGSLRESVDEMLDSSELDLTGEGREVIEAYRLFAYDQGWRQRMRDAVRTGLTAEAAVERVQDEMRLRVQRLGDPILRERAHDFDDLARRLLRHLTGDGAQGPAELPRECGAGGARAWAPPSLWIMGAAVLLLWCWKKRRLLRHVAIVARSHGPAAGGVSWKASPMQPAPAMSSPWMVKREKCICGHCPNIVAAFEDKRALRANRPGAFAAVARPARRHPRRRAYQADDECGLDARHAASGGIWRRRHRAVPHRTAIHDRRDDAAPC